MSVIKIKKGLNLPITGSLPKIENISETKKVTKVALLGDDYIGMKPSFEVKEGDVVKLGQLLFNDKKTPGVKYTAPAAGKVVEINRGEKRKFLSIVIQIEGNDEITFENFSEGNLLELGREKVQKVLIDSGMWTSIKSRPFGKVAAPRTTPHSIFVNLMDTSPLAPPMDLILKGNENHLVNGVKVLRNLTEGKIFICKSPKLSLNNFEIKNTEIHDFDGPHPAGLVGTHIHMLDPVSRNKTVWYIGLQDVIAIGKLFTSGKLDFERVISIAGPGAKNPKVVKTRMGASISEIINGETISGEIRPIAGSVLNGYDASQEGYGYLGKFHQTVSLIAEGTERKFLGWLLPGSNVFSITNAFLAAMFKGKKFNLTTSTNGNERAMVPIGNYEQVTPLDIVPTYLLRALAVDDVEEAEKLGCLEIEEEDLALCTVVCSSKIDHGKNLRRNLTLIEKEG